MLTSLEYAAVGTRPTTDFVAGLITATASSPESAAKTRAPSGETATATGAVPIPSGRPTETVPTSALARVSITAISSRLVIAAYNRWWARSMAIPSGWEFWLWTGIVAVDLARSRSSNDTVPSYSLVTYAV